MYRTRNHLFPHPTGIKRMAASHPSQRNTKHPVSLPLQLPPRAELPPLAALQQPLKPYVHSPLLVWHPSLSELVSSQHTTHPGYLTLCHPLQNLLDKHLLDGQNQADGHVLRRVLAQQRWTMDNRAQPASGRLGLQQVTLRPVTTCGSRACFRSVRRQKRERHRKERKPNLIWQRRDSAPSLRSLVTFEASSPRSFSSQFLIFTSLQ